MYVTKRHSRWRRVFHPTDLSDGSLVAFHHAVRLALALEAELDMVHVGRRRGHAFRRLPGVRETVAEWRRRAPDEISPAPVRVRKTAIRAEDAGPALFEHLEERPAELVVLTSHQRQGWDRLRHGDLAIRLARGASRAALLLPSHAPGFVDPEIGRLALSRVLLPIDHRPSPQRAVNRLVGFLDRIVEPLPSCTLLHVTNGAGQAPEVEIPAAWTTTIRQGEPEQEVLQAADDEQVSLIAMASEGRSGLREALQGSFAERVLRESQLPMLLLPRAD